MISELENKPGRKKAIYFKIYVNGYTIDSRVDTGADITCIPLWTIDENKKGRRIKIMDYGGSISLIDTYLAHIEFDNREFDIEVLPTNDPIGLIGMDVISGCHLEMCAGICILE